MAKRKTKKKKNGISTVLSLHQLLKDVGKRKRNPSAKKPGPPVEQFFPAQVKLTRVNGRPVIKLRTRAKAK